MQKSGFTASLLRPFGLGILAGAAALLLPLLSVGKGQSAPPAQLLPAVTPPPPSPSASAEEPWDACQSVRLLRQDGTVEELSMDEYLRCVVAAEMPARFESEALRAQAVCARTYTLWKMSSDVHSGVGAHLCDDSGCCQAFLSREDAEARWEDLTEAYSARIAAAVADTDGCILTYEGAPIQAVFFSSSTAATEDAAAVWGNSVPYLVSVDSPEGEEVPNFHSTVTLTAGELKALLSEAGIAAPALTGDPSGWIGEITRTASGRVAELRLGGAALSGTAVRALLGLRSACFDVEEDGGLFTFSVTGYGHGVGMSQYGANAMAADGAQWEDIVSHYYTGVTIQRAP